MAIDLKTMAGNTAEVTVTIGSQSMKVTYYPSRVTLARLETLTAKDATQDDQFDFLVGEEGVLKAWDLREGTKKLPLTKASLKKVPAIILRAIFTEIRNDTGTGDDEGEA